MIRASPMISATGSELGFRAGQAPPSHPIRRRARIALQAPQQAAEHLGTTLGRHDPWTAGPRRVVAHMLIVTTLELGDPVAFVVLVEANDSLLHRLATSSLCRTRWIAGATRGNATRCPAMRSPGVARRVR